MMLDASLTTQRNVSHQNVVGHFIDSSGFSFTPELFRWWAVSQGGALVRRGLTDQTVRFVLRKGVDMHRSRKPVRKCHGCGLNFVDHCGVYEDPRAMWQRHTVCPGFENEQMLADYLAKQAKTQAKPDREKRKLVAKRRSTAQHLNGDQHVVISTSRG